VHFDRCSLPGSRKQSLRYVKLNAGFGDDRGKGRSDEQLAPEQRPRGTTGPSCIAKEMLTMQIGFDTLVDDVMRDEPSTIRVFLDFKMRCVGCPIACFHTVDDACREHGVDRDRFLAALGSAASAA
jgi:hybrid cluster-associated redox disulfide protein